MNRVKLTVLLLLAFVLSGFLFYLYWGLSLSPFPLRLTLRTPTGLFETRASLPTARTESGSTVCQGKIVIAGGLNSFAQTLTSVQIYDPVTDVWTDGPDLPEPINHASLTSLGDTVYVVGGFGPLGLRLRWFMFARWDPLPTVYKLHLPSGQWITGAPMPVPRGAGGIALVDSVIWYVGGIDENREFTNTSFRYDIRTNRWSEGPPMTTRRDHLRVEAVGHTLYAISGRQDDLRLNLSTVEALNTESLTWKTCASIPIARGGLGSVQLDGKIYTFGGEMTWTCLDQLERYDPATDSWEVLDPLPEGRHGIQGAVVNGVIHLISGGRHPRVSISGIHRTFTPSL